jgi:hypothetical protein
MSNSKIFIGTPKLGQRLWFYLTCWRPINKYEFSTLQLQLITILEGMRESDLEHYQTEKLLVDELKKILESKKGINQEQDNKEDKNMYS